MCLPRTKLSHIILGLWLGNRIQSPGDISKALVHCGVHFIWVLNKKTYEMSVVTQLYNDRGRRKGKDCLLEKVFFCLWMWFSGCQHGENSISLHTNHSDVPSMYSKSRGWTFRLIQVEWGFVIAVCLFVLVWVDLTHFGQIVICSLILLLHLRDCLDSAGWFEIEPSLGIRTLWRYSLC